MTELVTRSPVRLYADAARVLARLFVPGHEQLTDRESRATGVLARVTAMSEEQVVATLQRVRERFANRHRDLDAVLSAHYDEIAHRVPDVASLSAERRDLVGAVFTNEFAIAGAALFNPSVVAHPDQTGVEEGSCRIVLSLRAVGEGHISSVEFRTGVVGPGRTLHIDEPGRHVETGRVSTTRHHRDLFAAKLTESGADTESTRYLLGRLKAQFDQADLDRALTALTGQRVTRHGGERTAELARRIARCSYEVEFSADTNIAERVLWPEAPTESRGIEDARFVRFTDDDDAVSYLATYTAFDGVRIEPQVIRTTDFRTFSISQLAGPAAKDKGMALFPRKVGGRYVALTRSDRENSGVAFSKDGRRWDEPTTVLAPAHAWEVIQTGNCGAPIETEAGWLVLTHGVGPMREYSTGALLLDLADPTRVLARLREPLLIPSTDEREGYVPNVVYSCGSLLHGDQLLLPYGASDASVRFAFVDVPELLARLTADGPPATIDLNSSA